MNHDENATNAMWYKIFGDAGLDSRLDRNLLATRILTECGTDTPIWTTTDTFPVFAAALFRSWRREIARDLDLLDDDYNQFTDHDYQTDGGSINARKSEDSSTYTPKLKHEENEEETVKTEGNKALNGTVTSNDSSTTKVKDGDVTTTHYVSADNSSNEVFQSRAKDVTETGDDSTTVTANGAKITDQTEESKGTTGREKTRTLDDTGEAVTANEGTVTGGESHGDRYVGRKMPGASFIDLNMRANAVDIYGYIALKVARTMMLGVW